MRLMFMISWICLLTGLNGRDFTISLASRRIQLTDFNYSINEIIDAREEKNCIGFVYRGLESMRTAAYLERPFPEELRSLIDRSQTQATGGSDLTIRINWLYIYELNTGSKAFAVAELSLSFLQKNSDASYTELFECAASKHISGIDITRLHAENISGLIEQTFQQFQQRAALDQLSKDSIQDNSQRPIRTFPVQERTHLPKGIFRHFTDFRDLIITGQRDFSVTYENRQDRYLTGIPRWKDDQKRIEGIWGFSDGTSVFIRIGKKYYALRRNGQDFIFTINAQTSAADQPGLSTFDTDGGLLQAMQEEWSSHTGEGNAITEFKLDFLCGQMTPYGVGNVKSIQGTSVIILSKFSKTPVQLAVDGQIKGTLEPGSYLSLTTGTDQPQIRLEFLFNGNRQTVAIKPELFQRHLFLCRSKTRKVKIRKLKAQMYRAVDKQIRAREFQPASISFQESENEE